MPGIAIVGPIYSVEDLGYSHWYGRPVDNLLYAMLAEAGIDRSDCEFHVALNSVAEAGENYEAAYFMAQRPADAQGIALATHLPVFQKCWYLQAKYEWHIKMLRRSLRQQMPDVVIACGRVASWAVTGAPALVPVLGKWQECRLYANAVALPTYAMGYVTLHPKSRAAMVEHFKLAALRLRQTFAEVS